MIIEEAQYEKCSECHRQEQISEERYGCDQCKAPIQFGKDAECLSATVFRHNDTSQELHFCSWDCALTNLAKVKTDYFISLPFLNYDHKVRGLRAKDFFTAMKRFGSKP